MRHLALHGHGQKNIRQSSQPLSRRPGGHSARAGASRTAGAHNLLTVVVTASASPLNPSTAILQELLLSLRLLQLPPGNPVLLSHDGPRLLPAALEDPSSPAGAFPPKYLQYLARVEALVPTASTCTGLAIRLLLRAANGNLAGNLAFALGHVKTPYVLKVEHDHMFVRPVDMLSVVMDLHADPRLKYVRFNRRANVRRNCDNGDYPRSLLGTEDERMARRLWGPHEPPSGTTLSNSYVRTACFSDMNHLTPTAYYRKEILPVILRDPKLPPETLMQDNCYLARNHSYYGTYIYGALDAPPTITHIDAALHGVGELLPSVRDWLRDTRNRVRNGTEPNDPFVCRPPRVFQRESRAASTPSRFHGLQSLRTKLASSG